MSLTFDQSVVLAAALAALGLAARALGGRDRRLLVAGLAATEASIVAGLYALWQMVGRLSIMNADHALERAADIVRWQHTLHFPSEVALQRRFIGHPLIIQASNLYYMTVHGVALLIFLVWLFAWHRDDYRAQRNTIAVVTGACLAVQFVPVAPPRMLTTAGFIDTGRLYHQSVYGAVGTGMSDQFSAMPSVHVAWAVLIALGVVLVGRSRWRWLVVLHPLVTVFIIVVTANHFWLDGVVAVAIIPFAWAVKWVARQALDGARSVVAAVRPRPEDEPAPVLLDLDLDAGVGSAELSEEVAG